MQISCCSLHCNYTKITLFFVSHLWKRSIYLFYKLRFGLQNIYRTVFPSSKHLNMLDGTWFVVCLPLDTFLVLISGISTSKYINYTYLVAVSTVNRPNTPYCLFLTAENVPLTFGFVLWLWKNHAHLFSNFETSKYLRWRLVCC